MGQDRHANKRTGWDMTAAGSKNKFGSNYRLAMVLRKNNRTVKSRQANRHYSTSLHVILCTSECTGDGRGPLLMQLLTQCCDSIAKVHCEKNPAKETGIMISKNRLAHRNAHGASQLETQHKSLNKERARTMFETKTSNQKANTGHKTNQV